VELQSLLLLLRPTYRHHHYHHYYHYYYATINVPYMRIAGINWKSRDQKYSEQKYVLTAKQAETMVTSACRLSSVFHCSVQACLDMSVTALKIADYCQTATNSPGK